MVGGVQEVRLNEKEGLHCRRVNLQLGIEFICNALQNLQCWSSFTMGVNLQCRMNLNLHSELTVH